MLVDFYNYGEGSVFNVAATLNGVDPPTNKIAPPLINATSPNSGDRPYLSLGNRAAMIGVLILGAWTL